MLFLAFAVCKQKVHANLAFLHVPSFNTHVFICVKKCTHFGGRMAGPHAMAQVTQWLILPWLSRSGIIR